MINAVGREIPEEILKLTGKEVFQGNDHFDGREFRVHGPKTACVINSNGSKLENSIHDVLVKCGLYRKYGDGRNPQDGDQGYHHLRQLSGKGP